MGAYARPAQGARSTDHLRDDSEFLVHFGLDAIGDLPGLDELQGAGLFDGQLPSGYGVPQPSDAPHSGRTKIRSTINRSNRRGDLSRRTMAVERGLVASGA